MQGYLRARLRSRSGHFCFITVSPKILFRIKHNLAVQVDCIQPYFAKIMKTHKLLIEDNKSHWRNRSNGAATTGNEKFLSAIPTAQSILAAVANS